MVENQGAGHGNPKSKPGANGNGQSDPKSGIIELSDIAIGITPEDDAIVELTEDVIDEAFRGFSGATREIMAEDEDLLDLSTERIKNKESDTHVSSDYDKLLEDDIIDSDFTLPPEDADEDITQELDNYFGTEKDAPFTDKSADTVKDDVSDAVGEKASRPDGHQDVVSEKIKVTANQLDNAIERVVRKLYAEKINRILDEVIEKTVSDEISQLKEYLLGQPLKKK